MLHLVVAIVCLMQMVEVTNELFNQSKLHVYCILASKIMTMSIRKNVDAISHILMYVIIRASNASIGPVRVL